MVNSDVFCRFSQAKAKSWVMSWPRTQVLGGKHPKWRFGSCDLKALPWGVNFPTPQKKQISMGSPPIKKWERRISGDGDGSLV